MSAAPSSAMQPPPTHESDAITTEEALRASLQRCSGLEEELAQLRREHERTTTKLSSLLKKRGAGEDSSETEAGAELTQLRQQVAVMQWREQQYKQIIANNMARPSPQSSSEGPKPVSGLADTMARPQVGAAARQASIPGRQITPPTPTPPSVGVKRPAPAAEDGSAKRHLNMASSTGEPTAQSQSPPRATAPVGYAAGAISVQPPKRRPSVTPNVVLG